MFNGVPVFFSEKVKVKFKTFCYYAITEFQEFAKETTRKAEDIIREETAEGTTSFLTTHNMFLADDLCDRVAFIIDGELKLIDAPKNLKLQYGQKLVDIEYIKDGKAVKETLKTVDEMERQRIGEIVNNYEIQTMHSKEATLEEIFIQVTGRKLVYNEAA